MMLAGYPAARADDTLFQSPWPSVDDLWVAPLGLSARWGYACLLLIGFGTQMAQNPSRLEQEIA